MTAPEPLPDDEIERMLNSSAPKTTLVTAQIEDELALMSVHARTDHVPSRRTRRVSPKVAALGLVGALVLGGGGAAAAVTGGWWTSWWANEPDAVVQYTLPSGAECEQRIGGLVVGTGYEPIRDFARQWYADADLDAIIAAGVDEQIAAQRADRERWFMEDDGTKLPAWYGTDLYATPDEEYANAVNASIQVAFDEALQESGLDLTIAPEGRGLSVAGEISCPGAKW
jgi:hypothetical protein